jgi:S1-C subfamily serine protease/antitoxin component YwqK of YwqJK toxin-antitoxin module
MKEKLIVLLVILITSLSITAQKQEKIYYDGDWKGCSQSKAEFYRIVTFDSSGKISGKIQDYFITGELQSEMDGAINIDKNDDKNSKFIGYSKGYYKNGKKAHEILHDNVGNQINGKNWYENGKIESEWEAKDGKPYGTSKQYYENGNIKQEITYSNADVEKVVVYYENGKLYRILNFVDGKLSDKSFIECDEFERCQKVFYEDFSKENNVNNWQLVTTENDYKSSIVIGKGLLMETKTENGFKQTINVPLTQTENFSIETIINFKTGEKNSGQGLIWGFKDWDNYYYFQISANGYYRIGAKNEGIDLEFAKWTQTDKINQNEQRNQIKVLRTKDKMYYSINGSLIHSEDFYNFRGNNVGFSILSGKKQVIFENLIIKQDIKDPETTKIQTNSSSAWRGNGSGFFVDYRGYIATNYHVIKDATEIEVDFIRNGKQQAYKAEVIQSDKQNDLAIIRISDNSFQPLINIPYNFQISLSDVGSNVFALGYPMANVMGTEIKFTDGKISSKTGIQGDITMYQISVPIQAGNSGGALFDYDGNLIGITSAALNKEYFNSENVNYAIKTSYLKNLIDVLPITLKLPNDKNISAKTLTEKIKTLSDYVVLIKIK